MKTSFKILFSASIILATPFLVSTAHSATYAGQDCVAKTGSLIYDNTGAKNRSTTVAASISCPYVRLNDGAASAAGGVVYFTNDGKTKSCFFDNFNIDTGGLWGWRSASGITRLAIPALNPTKPWSPFTLNCTLPASSKVTGYFLSE
jgi:hypothetical protein